MYTKLKVLGDGAGGRNDFPTTPSEMTAHPGQRRSRSQTMHSSHQPRFELYQNRIFAKSQPYTVEQKLAVAEIRGYTNCQWRVRFSGSLLLFQLFRANSKSQQNIICKIMRNETAEAKKGTWKGRRRCTPGQRHKEEAKPGAIPTF